MLKGLSDDATVVTYDGMSREPFQAGVGQFIFSNLTRKGAVDTNRWIRQASSTDVAAMFNEIGGLIKAGVLHVPIEPPPPGTVSRGPSPTPCAKGGRARSFSAWTDPEPTRPGLPDVPRTAVVTGCSSGISAAAARLLRHRGWTMLPTARKPADLDIALRGRASGPVDLDVADGDSTARAAGEIPEPAPRRQGGDARW
ncbi:MAG: hypothetical protein U1F77_00940 [Kiritimatiellia bacterium]